MAFPTMRRTGRECLCNGAVLDDNDDDCDSSDALCAQGSRGSVLSGGDESDRAVSHGVRSAPAL